MVAVYGYHVYSKANDFSSNATDLNEYLESILVSNVTKR